MARLPIAGENSVKKMVVKSLLAFVLLLWVAQSAMAQGVPRAPGPARPGARAGAPTQGFGGPRQKVPMESVFFNVVWGSAMGATIGVAAAVLGSDDPSQPRDVRKNAFSGATAGGLIGVGLGMFFVYTGITFDDSASPLFPVMMRGENDAMLAGSTAPVAPAAALADLSPFSVTTAPTGPLRITGVKARVFSLRF